MKISDVSDDDLLSGLAEPAEPIKNSIVTWLEDEHYYPGTTRISATDFYNRYRDWCDRNSGIITEIANFGQVARELTARFPKKRRKDGIYYYFSRDEVPHVPDDLGG